MALSQDLVSQFAKLTAKEDKDEGVTLKGTYKKIGGIEYVQIDGSDILTPVTSTVEAETGERVNVLIKDHMATVMSNITSPSARNKSLEDLKDEVDEQGNTIKQMDNTIIQQGNSIIQMNNSINQQNNVINQHDTKINQQGDTIVSLNNTIVAQGNTISGMNNVIVAQGNSIDTMNNTIKEHGDNITSINNTIVSQGNTIIQQGNTIKQHGDQIDSQNNVILSHDNKINQHDDLIHSQGNIINLQGNDITILNSGFKIVDGKLTGLSEIITDDLTTNILDARYADIEFANIDIASVENLFSKSGIIKDLVVDEGHITGELVGVTISGDTIIGNTIRADKLVVRGENGLYYKLNVAGETVEAEQTNENSLNGTVIAAKSITASKISVSDLVAFGATIGGFVIDDDSIHSKEKTSMDSPIDGSYLGSDGQFYFGNEKNHIKYYKDEDGYWDMHVRLNKLYLGASNKTAEEMISSEVEVSADGVKTIFKKSGGSNLLRNSVGFSGLDFWDVAVGDITTNTRESLTVSQSSIILKGECRLEQYYQTIPENEYSISFKYKHKQVGPSDTVKVEIEGTNGNHITVLETAEENTEWKTCALEKPYTATSTRPKIIITCTGNDEFVISDLIIARGMCENWSQHEDEIYGENHKLDGNGLRLYSSDKISDSNLTSKKLTFTKSGQIVGEISDQNVKSANGEFTKSNKIGKLRIVALDDENIIEYV